MANRWLPEHASELHHFVADSPWPARAVTENVQRDILETATRRGPLFAVLGTFAQKKKGSHSFGVELQRCGGRRLRRCQCFVSVALVGERVRALYAVVLRHGGRSWTTALRDILTTLPKRRRVVIVDERSDEAVTSLVKRTERRWLAPVAPEQRVLSRNHATTAACAVAESRLTRVAGAKWLASERLVTLQRRRARLLKSTERHHRGLLAAMMSAELLPAALRAQDMGRLIVERFEHEVGGMATQLRSERGIQHHAALALAALRFLDRVEEDGPDPPVKLGEISTC